MADRIYDDAVVRACIVDAYFRGMSSGEPISDGLIAPEGRPIDGSTSDGYHTFDELYHHRAVLFSVIVAMFPERSWKSLRHADGSMYDGMFIVGIETPDGQATYHYDVDEWDEFWCDEFDVAPEWDGHTPEQAIERIGSLKRAIVPGPKPGVR